MGSLFSIVIRQQHGAEPKGSVPPPDNEDEDYLMY